MLSPMPVPTYTVTCTRKALIARDTYEVAFEKPAGFTFKGGQFALFKVPLLSNPNDIQTRAYSLASAPDEPELMFVIKLKKGGRASEWMEKVVEPGLRVELQGPFGLFLLKGDPTRELLFIATGAGIAPFRSQILEATARGDTRRMDIILGVRSEEDVFWKEELERLSQRTPNVFTHIALSQPGETWTGHKGRVQTLVPLVAPDLSSRTVYICGNPDMTKELKTLALEQWGVPKEHLHVEGFI